MKWALFVDYLYSVDIFTLAQCFSLCLQIEFYFGDANLPKDKFLQQKMSEDPNGCMYTFCNFCGA